MHPQDASLARVRFWIVLVMRSLAIVTALIYLPTVLRAVTGTVDSLFGQGGLFNYERPLPEHISRALSSLEAFISPALVMAAISCVAWYAPRLARWIAPSANTCPKCGYANALSTGKDLNAPPVCAECGTPLSPPTSNITSDSSPPSA